MYLPSVFRDDDRESTLKLCQAHPFGMLVAQNDGEALEIAHLPLAVREEGETLSVFAHVARGNRLAKLAEAGARMTAVFRGPHAYVSPRWYEHPTRQVPTWNYVVAHVEGPSRVTTESELATLLDDLSRTFEAGAEDPWSANLLAPDFAADLRRGIVGICIRGESVSCKAKLSQNRSVEDHARVIRALRARGAPDDLALAERMTRDTKVV
jgi:transcriptional regulator